MSLSFRRRAEFVQCAFVTQYRPNRQFLVARGEIDHHVADMTATIAADMTLATVQDKLAAAGQWLPIDGKAQLRIGELAETNSTGPLRLGFGHWRDLLLGAQFTNGNGELITAGGRTVKNVAGYDLTKFMIGQRGIFGRLVTLTVRTYKRPAGTMLATFAPKPRLIDRLIPSPLRPQWAMLTSDALLCGYMGDERTLAYYSKALPDWQPRAIQRRTLEADIAHREKLWRGEFRASVPPAQVMQFIATAKPAQWIADPAFGIVLGACSAATSADVASAETASVREAAGEASAGAARLREGVGESSADTGRLGEAVGAASAHAARVPEAADEPSADAARIREAARSLAGTVIFEPQRGQRDGSIFDVPPGPQRELLERLKKAFDPDNRLAPLPWQNA